MGLRYRVDAKRLHGRPDLVFASARVVVFVDGDFWHGRNLKAREAKLRVGHNAPYWIAKIRANVERDQRNTAQLIADGWLVLRFWETEIVKAPDDIAKEIARAVRARR
jgi:DNA mismatch endonuclease (patch repair protein)